MKLPQHQIFKSFEDRLNSPFIMNAPRFGGDVGGWIENQRTTLGSGATSIDVTGIDDKRYYMILIDTSRNVATVNDSIRAGNGSFDSLANYARRTNANGTGDGVAGSLTSVLSTLSTVLNVFQVHYLANLVNEDKLFQGNMVQNILAGAGTIPQRNEMTYKWSNNAVLERYQFATLSTDQYQTGNEIVVLEWSPEDSHSGNFWEELDFVQGDNTAQINASIANKKYLWVQGFIEDTLSLGMRFNGDATNLYARRYSINGGSDITTGNSQNNIGLNATTTTVFFNTFIVNNGSKEKLVIHHTVERGTAGAGTPPTRFEVVAKWANNSNPITAINLIKSSNFSTNSFFKVWGAN